MAKRTHTFQVIVEQDEAGWYVVECPALKGCYTQGKTYVEALENIKDVISLCLDERTASR
jgi:predicted RNase H-like HicB family nuclease